MTNILSRRDSPEKREMAAARQLMQTVLGFDFWNLSQSRATKQTPGWPDALFSRDDGVAVFYECKAPGGKQSVHQKAFEEMCARCGMAYVKGPADELQRWVLEEGLCTITNGLIRVRRPGESSGRLPGEVK